MIYYATEILTKCKWILELRIENSGIRKKFASSFFFWSQFLSGSDFFFNLGSNPICINKNHNVIFCIMSNVCDTLTYIRIVVLLWIRENLKERRTLNLSVKKNSTDSNNNSVSTDANSRGVTALVKTIKKCKGTLIIR